MRLQELFSGTKSVGRAFKALGWEATSLRPKEAPRHGPVNASSGSLTSVLLRNPVISRMLKQPA